MPAAVDGEFGFAASGTCLETAGRHDVYLGSGGAVSRIFHSRDGGRHWTVTDAPIPAAPGGGVSSLAFRGPRVGVAAGGDFDNPDVAPDSAAFTRNGRTWTGSDPGGYRSGVDWVPGSRRTLVAVGLNGSDVSRDGGRTWSTFSGTGFHAVVCVRDRHTCWASGQRRPRRPPLRALTGGDVYQVNNSHPRPHVVEVSPRTSGRTRARW